MASGRIQRELALLLTGKDVSWSKTAKGAEKSMSRLHAAGAKAGTNMARNLERGMIIAGAAAVGAGAFAVNAAMDFESSGASVRKTIEGNVDAILTANRELSKTAGLEVNALNEISATAGALGIAKDDVDDFTKTVAMLGQTTDDVTTDVGATSLGHLKTTLNLAGTDFEHLGNTLVHLGNDGASTEGQILSMTENIAGAANTLDASTQQVLGWAAAVANTGEEAEAGGSSIQRFWLESFKSINKGGKELQLMAKISGQTADQFQKDFGRDATGTLAKFVVSLGKTSKAEQLATLEALGFTDIRITRALLKLLGNTDNLTDSLALAEKGWLENSAGTEEWGKRLDTTASKLAILKANVNDAAITIGTELLPVLAELSTDAVKWISEHQGEIAQFSKDLASGVREAVTWARSLDWDAIGAGLGMAASAAGTIVQAFTSAPPWVQAFLIGGFAANKFTGGAVMDLGKIAFDQFAGRGTSPANPVWVAQAGGGALGGAGAAGGAAGGAGKLLKFAGALGLATLALELWQGTLVPLNEENARQTESITQSVQAGLRTASREVLEQQRDALGAGLQGLLNTTQSLGPLRDILYGGQINGLKADIEAINRELETRGPSGRPREVVGTVAADRFRQATQTMGGISPGERDERLAAILKRSAAAGRTPRDPAAAAQATLSRTLVREQVAARAAAERTTARIDAAKTAASINSLAEQRAGERDTGRIVAAINGMRLPAPIVNVSTTARSIDVARTRYHRVNNRPPGTGPLID